LDLTRVQDFLPIFLSEWLQEWRMRMGLHILGAMVKLCEIDGLIVAVTGVLEDYC
jgi:hypothetical protein